MKPYCKWGHPLSDEAVYHNKDGTKTCKKCKAQSQIRYQRRCINGEVSTHCRNGHERTDKNTSMSASGRVRCKDCRKSADRARVLRENRYLACLRDYTPPAPPEGRTPVCEGIDPLHADVLFFEGYCVGTILKEVRRLCSSCPVASACRRMVDATEVNVTTSYGFYAGETPLERAKRRGWVA